MMLLTTLTSKFLVLLGQIAGVDASLTSLVLLMSLMHVAAAKANLICKIQSLSVLAKRSIYKLI